MPLMLGIEIDKRDGDVIELLGEIGGSGALCRGPGFSQQEESKIFLEVMCMSFHFYGGVHPDDKKSLTNEAVVTVLTLQVRLRSPCPCTSAHLASPQLLWVIRSPWARRSATALLLSPLPFTPRSPAR